MKLVQLIKNSPLESKDEFKKIIKFNDIAFKPHYKENNYAASKGQILNVTRKWLLQCSIITTGYKSLTISVKGSCKNYRVHRFCFECWVKPIDKNMVIDHIDENELDNRLENLNVVTQEEIIKQ